MLIEILAKLWGLSVVALIGTYMLMNPAQVNTIAWWVFWVTLLLSFGIGIWDSITKVAEEEKK